MRSTATAMRNVLASATACLVVVSLCSAGPPDGPATRRTTGGRRSPGLALAGDRLPRPLTGSLLHSLNVRSGTVVTLPIAAAPGEAFEVSVPIAGVSRRLVLRPHTVRDDRYELLVSSGHGALASAEPGPIRTLRGAVAGMPGSAAAGSLLEAGLVARIAMPDGREYWLEPLQPHMPGASPDDYVVYERQDVIPCGGRCALDDAPAWNRTPDRVEASGGGRPCGVDLCVAELACDADVEYFQTYGSVPAVESRINAVINMVNFQYERDVAITHVITTVIVRTAEPDPYTSTSSVELLNEFQDEWNVNQGGVTRDLAQLFTGKEIGGVIIGRAVDIGVVCDTAQSYCFVQSDYNGVFTCATDLSTHELGHLWGAFHCTCPEYTMHTSITCANQFHPSWTVPDILAHRDSRTCLSGSRDLQTPIPDPMTFESAPAALSSTEITMTATLALDAMHPPVEYEFDLFSGGLGGDDSGWQSSRVYTDTGLMPETTYRYRVRARDSASPPNVTAYSVTSAATTNPAPVCGNGVVEEDEQCDPPDWVTCDGNCRIIPPDCAVDADCDDGNVCTDDTCEAGHCAHVNNNAPCNTDACFPHAACQDGVCVDGAPLVCDDGNPCTDDSCQPSLGCQFDDNADPCDDGDACTVNDTCSGGTCVGEPVTTCDDGDPCTTNEICVGGVCTGTQETDCDDGNPCTADGCDPAMGCVHDDIAGPCDDGNICTTGDTCVSGVCVGGAPLDCDDGNSCTDDFCDSQSGCTSTPRTGPCDDGNICTADDTCAGGQCGGTPAPYGDVNGDGRIDIIDIFCALDGFQGVFIDCTELSVDIAQCRADGVIDIEDIFAVLDAFQGIDPCCGG